MITTLHHSDYTLKNRAFNCRMRNRYYEEVYYAFRALFPNDVADRKETNQVADTVWFQHLGREIKRYERLLMTCLEYAQAAVFYGKAENASLYSKDKRWGILQEEIFMVHFLQELLSTTRYVIARIETDHMLQQWSGEMQDMKTKPVGSGYVNAIQQKLNAMNAATIDEFKDLLRHVLERFQIGNTLFGTIQELQNFY
ncbi:MULTISPECIES: hypothetical protein [unclassified Fibrobacter]|uniref:hypothetical protein n=1 Tax=unclassified Fibrobacter TaxID=2634177 RepID=UPI000D6AADF2|nr:MULTISPECIES: hypothetical protein [unclassified Fibrobacter]PWJ71971.1 hypothetical protein BGX12_101210 [Fibrobacter sp. UWR4]PZW70421.1 hypothetical protein C8E88_101278 [Fibrobacter sp. UWR1]